MEVIENRFLRAFISNLTWTVPTRGACHRTVTKNLVEGD